MALSYSKVPWDIFRVSRKTHLLWLPLPGLPSFCSGNKFCFLLLLSLPSPCLFLSISSLPRRNYRELSWAGQEVLFYHGVKMSPAPFSA